MKKLFLVLLAFCFTPCVYAAAYGSAIFSDNKEEDNAIRMVYGVQAIYKKNASFKNLEHIPLQKFWLSTYEPLTDEDKINFELTTEDGNQVAVIKYAVKDCDSLKDAKEKLLKYETIKESDYVDCFNNQFVTYITKEKVESLEESEVLEEYSEEVEQENT